MSRELPHSTEAEQSILGAMMIYPSVTSVVYDQGLDVRDFYLDIHQRIFSAMMDITDSGKPVDVTTLIARLQDIEQLNLVGGADYIIKLSDTAISSANSVYYIEMIKSRAHLRRLIRSSRQIAEDGLIQRMIWMKSWIRRNGISSVLRAAVVPLISRAAGRLFPMSCRS